MPDTLPERVEVHWRVGDGGRRRAAAQGEAGAGVVSLAIAEQDRSMPAPSAPIATRSATCVRAASEADMAAVREVYAHYVLHSLATFEETPPTLEDMLMRPSRVGRSWPALSGR
jgi:hypothetical protein